MGEEARRKRSDAIDQLRARLVSLEATDDRATEVRVRVRVSFWG